MKIILLSGGSGKRLWPLSNDIRSKQFLKVLKNDDNEYESMVQRVYRQIRSVEKNTESDIDIIIATGKTQVDSIKGQLGDDIDIVVEPERRDTFPAILLSAAYLYYKKSVELSETIIILPVDPYANISYFEMLPEIENVVKAGMSDMVLMGIKPTYPSAKYGYIVPKEDTKRVLEVKEFVEKPSEVMAMKLIEQGALWNGGVFAFSLEYIVKIMRQYFKGESFEGLVNEYFKLPKISFDYEIVEKCKSISAIKYDGLWKDLGTWNTLTEEISEVCIGSVMEGENCKNTHVINELDIPIVTLGLENVVVAASPDGILVSDKEKSSFIKSYVDHIERRPMYEECRWGEYKVLDYTQYEDGMYALTRRIIVNEGKEICYQLHNIRDEIWTIVDGKGDLVIDGHIRNVRRGDVVYITKGQKHAIYAVSKLQFIEVQIGLEISEDDKKEYKWKW